MGGLVIGIVGSLIMGKIRRRKMESMMALQTDSSESDGSITDTSDIEHKTPMRTSTGRHPSLVVERTSTTEIHGQATASQLAFAKTFAADLRQGQTQPQYPPVASERVQRVITA